MADMIIPPGKDPVDHHIEWWTDILFDRLIEQVEGQSNIQTDNKNNSVADRQTQTA